MAFDTVIDKAQLEGAITASANAIREKTGDTALIEWLADKGFAEAIAAIESGGGLKNKSFTVEDTSENFIVEYLDDTPKMVTWYDADFKTSSNNVIDQYKSICALIVYEPTVGYVHVCMGLSSSTTATAVRAEHCVNGIGTFSATSKATMITDVVRVMRDSSGKPCLVAYTKRDGNYGLRSGQTIKYLVAY